MRVVIKPAGVIILLCMLVSLATLAYLRNRAVPDPVVSPLVVNGASTLLSLNAAGNLLINSGFEGNFDTLPPPTSNATAKITGERAASWFDNSEWGKSVIEYTRETNNPHTGSVCQKIHIVSLESPVQLQLVQQVPADRNQSYTFSVWLRSDREEQKAYLLLRQSGGKYTEYKATEAVVGKEWKQYSVTGTSQFAETMNVMVNCNVSGATIWVDDATLTRTP